MRYALSLLLAATYTLANAGGVPGQGTWETTLKGRDLDGNLSNGYEAYYDTTLNITWLADANYAKTSGYVGNGVMDWGSMPWQDALVWADQLTIGGYSDWRLPRTIDLGKAGCDLAVSGTDCGYNVNTSSSELAHLFFVTLGNSSFYSAAGVSQEDQWKQNAYGPFLNVKPSQYWSSTRYALNPNNPVAWTFNFHGGFQRESSALNYHYAWAVRDGDVAAVPEPESLALMGVGLAALMLRRRSR